MLMKLWRSIAEIGVRKDYSEKKIRRVRLINQYTVVTFLLYMLNGLSDLLLGFTRQGLVLEGSALIFIVALFLNKFHLHRATVIFLFLFVALSIFYFSIIAGLQCGDYLYYFPLILAISFAFDFSKDKWQMFVLFAFIIILVFINTLAYPEFAMAPKTSDPNYRRFMVNLSLSTLTLGFFIYLTAKNNAKINELYEQRILQKEDNEARIKKTLAEKEILLAELHHRVKNNLAVMAGFFSLKLNSTDNHEAKEILLESRNRVNSMALIHNQLYRKDDFSEINFTAFITELVDEIKGSYPSISKSIKVQTNIGEINLNLNSAIPCALILNELLSNCYKHAFKNRNQGIIWIDFLPLPNGDLKLLVKDDGHGLAEDFKTRESMGLTVVESLSQQLNGTHSYVSDKGTCFEMLFNPAMV